MQTKPIHCVWVVDDDPLQVLILNRFLTTHQLMGKTKFFSGAKSAIEGLAGGKLANDDTPELIFLDLVMVRGDGWDFLDYYRKVRPKLSRQAEIIVISSANEENQRRLQNYPEVTRFLSKPIDKKEFDDLIETVTKKA